MILKKAIVTLGFILGFSVLPTHAVACGDYCDWGGLYNTTGYSGYGLGSTLYDISNYTTTSVSVSVDYGYSGGYGGGCGSFSGSCGGYTPSCGSSYGDYGGGVTPYDIFMAGSGNPMGMNPMTFPGSGSYQDPMLQTLMMSTLGNPYSPNGFNPITSTMNPQMFPPFGLNNPYAVNPFPGTNPYFPNLSLLPNMTPYYPYTGPSNPLGAPYTTPYSNPYNPYGTQVPPVSNPAPTTTISQPPPTPLTWGGCDNIIVMCPTTGPIGQPPTVGPVIPLTPVSAPFSVQPQYETTPTDPTRYKLPRGTHGR